MHKSDDQIISTRIYKLLINKLSNTIISDAVNIQHKYKSDYEHDIIFCKL